MSGSEQFVVGITECGVKFDNYAGWIERAGRKCRIVKLSAVVSNVNQVDECDGIVLTGGGDIHPRLYGRPELLATLDPAAVDEKRDEFELSVVERADRLGVPLLGICRGLQVANVLYGGSIIPDLTAAGKPGHEAGADRRDSRHTVGVQAGSMLAGATRCASGTVNSAHHQAAGSVGRGLAVAARSEDGVIEALESGDLHTAPKILVQWHPERLEAENIMAAGVRSVFFTAVAFFSLSH